MLVQWSSLANVKQDLLLQAGLSGKASFCWSCYLHVFSGDANHHGSFSMSWDMAVASLSLRLIYEYMMMNEKEDINDHQ